MTDMTDVTNMINWFSKTSKFLSQQDSKVSGHKLKTILFPEYALQVTINYCNYSKNSQLFLQTEKQEVTLPK